MWTFRHARPLRRPELGCTEQAAIMQRHPGMHQEDCSSGLQPCVSTCDNLTKTASVRTPAYREQPLQCSNDLQELARRMWKGGGTCLTSVGRGAHQALQLQARTLPCMHWQIVIACSDTFGMNQLFCCAVCDACNVRGLWQLRMPSDVLDCAQA